MTRTVIGTLALGLALGLASETAAQQRRAERDDDRNDRRERIEERRRDQDARRWRRDRRVVDRRRDRAILERILGQRDRGVRGRGVRGGPAFCRSGAGHPVFGRRWCLEKGFGLGRSTFLDRDRRFGGILRGDHRRGRTLPEIILGHRLPDHRFRTHRHLGRADLGDLLGLAVRDYLLYELLGLAPYRARHVTGRWHDARHHDRRGAAWWQAGHRSAPGLDPLALQLFLDGERLVELADLDRDGRVDLLLDGR